MGIHKDYETLADNLCDIHFLYSRDLSNVFEQHSTRGEEAALFWLSRLENPVSAGELASKLGITHMNRRAGLITSQDVTAPKPVHLFRLFISSLITSQDVTASQHNGLALNASAARRC